MRNLFSSQTEEVLKRQLTASIEQVDSRVDQLSTVSRYRGLYDASGPSYTLTPTPLSGDWLYVMTEGTQHGDDLHRFDVLIYNGTDWEIVAGQSLAVTDARGTYLNTNPNVYADGEQGKVSPDGEAGWYYKNTANQKINWYFYGDTVFSDNRLSEFGGFYAVVTLTAPTSYLYPTVYTLPEGDGNDASWYRSRITYNDEALMQAAAPGRYLVHTSNMDVTAIEPDLPRISLPVDNLTTAGPQGSNEQIWLMALSTSSNYPEGYNEFTVERIGSLLGDHLMIRDLHAVHQEPPFNEYYRGTSTDLATIQSPVEGQYVCDVSSSTIKRYDGSAWVDTSVACNPASAGGQADVAYPYVYSEQDGSGYGFMNAVGNWSYTPEGELQANGGTTTDDNTVKFATLVNIGDSVTINHYQHTTNLSYYRHAFSYVAKGHTPSFYPNRDIGSGRTYYFNSASHAYAFGHNSYVKPYYGTSSYAGGMTAIINNYVPANSQDVKLTWRINSDYKLEFLIDDNVVSRSTLSLAGNFASGIDLYAMAKYTQIVPQPSGTGIDINGTPDPNASSTWNGPSYGTDFDGVNDYIELPTLSSDWRPHDGSSFSVSAQMQPVGSNAWTPFYNSPNISFSLRAWSTTTFTSQGCSPDPALAIGYQTVYTAKNDSFTNQRTAMTLTFAGADSADCQALRKGTQFSYKFATGTYDGASKTFTADPNGPNAYATINYDYNGSLWMIMQDTNGLWWRALASSPAVLTNGNPFNYNQTLVGATGTTTAAGVDIPPTYSEASSWIIYLNGHWANGRGYVSSMSDFPGTMKVGVHTDSVGGLHYGEQQDMTDWILSTPLSIDAIDNLHNSTFNIRDARDWATEEGVTLRLYYPLHDPLQDGDAVEDYSTNTDDATARNW